MGEQSRTRIGTPLRACSVDLSDAFDVGSVSSNGQLGLVPDRATSDIGRVQRCYRTGSNRLAEIAAKFSQQTVFSKPMPEERMVQISRQDEERFNPRLRRSMRDVMSQIPKAGSELTMLVRLGRAASAFHGCILFTNTLAPELEALARLLR